MSTTTQGSKWLEVPNTAEGNLWLYHQLRKGVDKDAIVAELRKRELYIPDSPIPLDRLVMKPLGPFPDFAACVEHMSKPKEKGGQGYDEETAKRVCGKMEHQNDKKDFNSNNNPNQTAVPNTPANAQV